MAINTEPVSRDEALALVEQLLLGASRRDISAIMKLYAEEAVAVSPVFGEVRGRAAIAASWETLFKTLADLTLVISDTLVDGNRVAVLSTLATTDRHGWFGRPATGGPIGYRLVLLLTVAHGGIVHDERIYDSAGVLERLEKARLDKELRTAADVQRALLPRRSHVGQFCESVGDSVPCRTIGGDFFEFLALPSGDAAIVMGDVSGKGPAAALLASLIQGMFAVEATAGGSPASTVSRINRRLAARDLGSRFATLVYGVLSADGRFAYSNAGHNPPMLMARDGVRRLTTGGTILGAFAEAVFEEEILQLQDGDTLVMFTDGVTEALGANDEEFGEERLMKSLGASDVSSAIDLLSHVFTAVREFSPHREPTDDITVTVTRFRQRRTSDE
jgi:ketosteroid isomerase-like protein